jgi:O-antigen/teichoic acid export membrane protein
VLVLLLAGNVAWAAAALSSLWLQYRGRAGVVLAISIATLIADSILNLLLIPRYGMTGAAAGTAATLSVAALAVVVAGRAPARS